MREFINYTDNHYLNADDPINDFAWRDRKQPVYRLLDNKKWLDDFFERGELALSCFLKFIHYPDEIRGDKEEGDAMVWFENTKGDTIAVKYQTGENCYVLCTTMTLNDKIISDFNAVGAIKIHNYTFFGLEVMRAIKNCYQGISGRCNYKSSRVFNSSSEYMKTIIDRGDHANNAEFYDELLRITSEYELFLKLKKYEYQDEFRLIWFSNLKVNESIIIKCPEALRHCERIDF